MSWLTLSKIGSVATPAANKGRVYFDSSRAAFCYVDENGAQWWYGEQRVRLTADMSGTTGTGLADVTGLVFALRASTRYAFEFGLVYRSTDTATGLKVALTCPAAPTLLSANVRIPMAADAAAAAWQGTITASGDAVTATGQEAANTDYVAEIRGVIVNGTTAGNLQLQWAAEAAAAGTVTPKQGSHGRLWLT